MPHDRKEILERLLWRCSEYPTHICATFCQHMITAATAALARRDHRAAAAHPRIG